MDDLLGIKDRVFLIIGGNGNLGYTFSQELFKHGAKVIVVDLCLDRYRHIDEANRPIFYQCDLNDCQSVNNTIKNIIKDQHKIDVLIHSAAMMPKESLKNGWMVNFELQESNLWPEALNINLTSSFIFTQKLVGLLKKGKNPSIINILSHYSIVGPQHQFYEGTEMANVAAYAASKGGLKQLTTWLSTTLSPTIRVNAISPGGIFRGQPDLFHDRYCKATPLGRMAREEDIVGAMLFLAGNMSLYVTGQNLVVDGGITSW